MSDEPGIDLRSLQDYLDGRLSSEQRAAFEARLEHDADLRLELEAAREVRAVLADEAPDLSPGFYTRARARFEESGRREKRWSFRLLSWETAGVAAAAALATALFVPRLMQEGIPTDLGAVATEKQQAVRQDSVSRPDSSLGPAPADARLLDEKEGLEEPPARDETPALQKNRAPLPPAPKAKRVPQRVELRDAPEPLVQEPAGFADTESDRREKSSVPGKKAPAAKPPSDKGDRRLSGSEQSGLSPTDVASGEAGRARIAQDDDAFHAAAPAEEAENALQIERLPEETQWEIESKDEGVYAERAQRASGALDPLQPVVVELPAGLVDRKQLRSVEQLEEWLDLLAGPHGDSIEMLGAPASNRRLVLIGARQGLACDNLIVTRDDRGYRIESVRAPEDREADGGCALVLPNDGRNVTIAKPR